MPKYNDPPGQKHKTPMKEAMSKKPSPQDFSEDLFARRFSEGLEELLKKQKLLNPNYPFPKVEP